MLRLNLSSLFLIFFFFFLAGFFGVGYAFLVIGTMPKLNYVQYGKPPRYLRYCKSIHLTVCRSMQDVLQTTYLFDHTNRQRDKSHPFVAFF